MVGLGFIVSLRISSNSIFLIRCSLAADSNFAMEERFCDDDGAARS